MKNGNPKYIFYQYILYGWFYNYGIKLIPLRIIFNKYALHKKVSNKVKHGRIILDLSAVSNFKICLICHQRGF